VVFNVTKVAEVCGPV